MRTLAKSWTPSIVYIYMNRRNNVPILVTCGIESKNVLKITRRCLADFTSRKIRPIRKILKSGIMLMRRTSIRGSKISSIMDNMIITKSNILLADAKYCDLYAIILITASNIKIIVKILFKTSLIKIYISGYPYQFRAKTIVFRIIQVMMNPSNI